MPNTTKKSKLIVNKTQISRADGKQAPYNKIIQVLRSGDVVTKDDLINTFSQDPKMSKSMYRLSTYIWHIKQDHGVVKVFKDGKAVVGYQLINYSEFNSDGFWVGKQEEKVEVEEAVEA